MGRKQTLEQVKTEAWHAPPTEEVLARLEATAEGLTSEEAKRRLEEHGPNELPRKPPPSVLDILVRQFQNPLIYILAAAAGVSLLLGEFTDAIVIALVLAVNGALGGYQEWRAEQSGRALEKMLKIRASVARDGEVQEIDAEGVVPGDIVWLESGNRIPADLRLISAQGLEIDESPMTGESLAVQKDAKWTGEEKTPLADRLNMAFAGTTVIHGRGRGLVVATGGETAIGQLAMDVMGAEGGQPPLILRLERFTRMIGVAVLVAAVIVIGIGLARGHTFVEMFFVAVALAVSAIPEGLPISVTVALAIASNRMAKRGVIVRKLAAVEGMGSSTLIASDKTGTLTCNELTVREVRLPGGEVFGVTGEGYEPGGEIVREEKAVGAGEHEGLEELLLAAALCNEGELHKKNSGWVWHGDPTDVALLSAAHKVGIIRETARDESPVVNNIPFEPERRYAASFHRRDGQVWAYVKGAFERVLEMLDASVPHEERDRLKRMAEEMAEQGFRVLAFAGGPAEGVDEQSTPGEPKGLKLLGLIGMIDPLRAGVKEAVEACKSSGIQVSMVTGDHPVTALAIGRELGLADSMEQVVAGAELSEMDEEELADAVKRARVFARIPPHDKLRIVEAARKAGHFVVVTGDGVNDAPALRAANIGVAMGRSGTDIARDAADIVISDDNFATIVGGIEQGRIAYNNIRKVIYLLVSTGAAEVVMVLAAVILGTPLPLLPVQLLWLNLVTNGIQDKALAFEPGEGDELERLPRPPRERIFNRLMIERTIIGASVMGLVGTAFFVWALEAGWEESQARSALLLLMVLFENVHIGNCRSETRSAFFLSPLRSPILLAGAIGALLVHVAAMYTPLGQKLLSIEPVALEHWAILAALAVTVFVAIELHKVTWRMRHGHSHSVRAEELPET